MPPRVVVAPLLSMALGHHSRSLGAGRIPSSPPAAMRTAHTTTITTTTQACQGYMYHDEVSVRESSRGRHLVSGAIQDVWIALAVVLPRSPAQWLVLQAGCYNGVVQHWLPWCYGPLWDGFPLQCTAQGFTDGVHRRQQTQAPA